jgi:hypothetical protein
MTIMTRTLLWLASPEKLLLKLPNTIDLVHDQILGSPEALMSITDTSLFNCDFFEILEMAYKRQLQPALITFGQGMMSAINLKEFIVASDEDDEDEDMQVEHETVEVVWEKVFKFYDIEVCNRVGALAQGKQLTADLTMRIVLDALGSSSSLKMAYWGITGFFQRPVPRFLSFLCHSSWTFASPWPTCLMALLW